MQLRSCRTTLLAIWILGSLSVNALAQSEEEVSAELAKASQNPVGNLISLPAQNNTNFGIGPHDETGNVLNIQPVWPLTVTPNWNVITRTIIPLVVQPNFQLAVDPGVETGDGNPNDPFTGLGDVTFTAWVSPAKPGKLIWGVGPVVLFPTGVDGITSEKWGVGPSIVLLTMPGSWVIGGLANNIWSVGGDKDVRDVNTFFAQYFITYNMPGGWYVTSAPIMTANWESAEGQRWTVPIGGGAGRVFKLGSQPINASLQGFVNVVKPDFGADWQLRLQFTLLFPK